MELLYLFNDFLVRDYESMLIGEKIQKICSNGCSDAKPVVMIRNNTDFSMNVNLHQEHGNKDRLNYCQECFGKQVWHDASLKIINLFVTKFRNEKFTYPCVSMQVPEKAEVPHYDNDMNIKTFQTVPLRNGGVVRILFQCILILIKGSIFRRIKMFNLSEAVCQSAEMDSSDNMRYSIKEMCINQSEMQTENEGNQEFDIEYDISKLINLLNSICFPKDVSNLMQDRQGRKSSDTSGLDSAMFFLDEIPKTDHDEIVQQMDYFDKPVSTLLEAEEECEGKCQSHNNFKVRGNLLNELLLVFSNMIDYEKSQSYNHLKDFALLPDQTV